MPSKSECGLYDHISTKEARNIFTALIIFDLSVDKSFCVSPILVKFRYCWVIRKPFVQFESCNWTTTNRFERDIREIS